MSLGNTHGLLQDSLIRSAVRKGSGVALGDGKERCTYDALVDMSLRFARGLQDLGLQRGDRVAIVMPNGIGCVVGMYGTLLAGGVFVILSPETKGDHLTTILTHSSASYVLGHAEIAPTVENAAAASGCVRAVVLDRAPPDRPEALTLESLVSGSEADPRDPGTISQDLAGLIFTSGTTGKPKGVMMTHQNLVYLAGSVSGYLRMDETDKILSVLSLGHTYGLSQLLISVHLGATLHLERSFVYLGQAAKLVVDESITTLPGVPTVFAMLLAMHRKSPLHLDPVKRVTCAGGALLPSFIDGLHEIFPNALLFPMYGLTECMRVCYLEPELVDQKPASVGRAIPGSEVWILDSNGEPVPQGEAGVLHVSGPHVMPGYWNDPELTAQMLVPGPVAGERSLRTGDHFRMDEDGHLYFVGRSDEIIKTRGEKVSPLEVESVLHGIPGILEAAVVGAPHDVFGEAIHAFVVPDETESITAIEVTAWCRERLESFKVPHSISIVDALPKTANGKVQRRLLVPPAFH